jgi:hypothetical protein
LSAPRLDLSEDLCAELWVSLGSLLRSYTALHGLHANRQAEIDQSTETIMARHGERWLSLTRSHAILSWTRDNGTVGTLEITEAGTLRSLDGEEAMDLAAEAWARSLMLEEER